MQDLTIDKPVTIDRVHYALNFDSHLKSELTAKNYHYILKKFSAFMNDLGVPLEKVTQQVVIDYMGRLESQGLENTTINNYIKALKRFYKMLIDKGLLEKNPVEGIKYLPEPKPIVSGKWLEEDDLVTIFRYLQQDSSEKGLRDHAIVYFLFSTGLRASELTNLRFSNINYDTMTISFKGKGKKKRTVEIDRYSLSLIEQYRKRAGLPVDNNDYIFYTTINNRYKYRKPINRHTLYFMLQNLGDKTGIGNIHPHIWRHTNISHLIKNGCPIHRASEHAGHSSIQTTMVYTHDSQPVNPYLDKMKSLIGSS